MVTSARSQGPRPRRLPSVSICGRAVRSGISRRAREGLLRRCERATICGILLPTNLVGTPFVTTVQTDSSAHSSATLAACGVAPLVSQSLGLVDGRAPSAMPGDHGTSAGCTQCMSMSALHTEEQCRLPALVHGSIVQQVRSPSSPSPTSVR